MLETIDWNKSAGLVPAIIQDAHKGIVLMLGYMNREALQKTLDEGIVTFYSRTKQRLWTKGETSGHVLKLKSCSLDCDKDTLLITAEPSGPVCHLETESCFTKGFTPFLQTLSDKIDSRFVENSAASYVKKLHEQGAKRIAQKVGEEGVEVALASVAGDRGEILEESADLLFHMLVNLRYHGISLNEVIETLSNRAKS